MNEVIGSIQKKKEKGILCMLDIEKVSDHLNLDVLLQVLERLGFG